MRAARYIYKKGRFDRKMLHDAPVVAAIRETYECLRPALGHLSHTTPKVVRDTLESNAFIFSGFKTYHTMREVGLSLTKDDGEIKPFAAFAQEVRAIHKRYNVRYLESEYDHAVGSALMADRWHTSAPKSILEYRTAGDSKVRPAHEALDRTRLPKGDPFWQDYFPPNGWGCRCDAIEVPSDTPLSNPQEAWERGDTALRSNKQELFRGNPGRDLRLFPDKHPYYGERGIAHCSIAKHSKDDEGECEVLAEVLKAQKGARKISLTPEQKEHRKALQDEAKARYQGTTIVSNGIPIRITKVGLKEFLNQPHIHYFEKTEILRHLQEVLQESRYLGAIPYHKGNPNIVQSHLFEITIEGDKTWIIAREDLSGEVTFHSITDDAGIIEHLKKK